MNNNHEINLEFEDDYYRYCTFNLKGEFILYTIKRLTKRDIIWIYSTQTKNNKWKCKKFYEIPRDVKLISISKYDKLFLYSNNSIYECNILTEKSTRLFYNEDIKYKEVQ
jgi:hypothetical protein